LHWYSYFPKLSWSASGAILRRPCAGGLNASSLLVPSPQSTNGKQPPGMHPFNSWVGTSVWRGLLPGFLSKPCFQFTHEPPMIGNSDAQITILPPFRVNALVIHRDGSLEGACSQYLLRSKSNAIHSLSHLNLNDRKSAEQTLHKRRKGIQRKEKILER
jgi:hypothetical protein